MKGRRGFGTGLLIGLALFGLVATGFGLSAHHSLLDEGGEVWWLELPGGHELDGQMTRHGWAVFWQAPDGTSTRLVGGR
jgi:hypothetical protein